MVLLSHEGYSRKTKGSRKARWMTSQTGAVTISRPEYYWVKQAPRPLEPRLSPKTNAAAQQPTSERSEECDFEGHTVKAGRLSRIEDREAETAQGTEKGKGKHPRMRLRHDTLRARGHTARDVRRLGGTPRFIEKRMASSAGLHDPSDVQRKVRRDAII